MRILLQRVSHASVTVDAGIVGRIDHGLLLLVGAGHDDDAAVVRKMAAKAAQLRIFNDDQGKFNLSLLDVGGGALVVSQFTLYADARQGRRPSFVDAARPDQARPLCDDFTQALRELGVDPVETGIFGASMKVELCNEGPVTIWLDSAEL